MEKQLIRSIKDADEKEAGEELNDRSVYLVDRPNAAMDQEEYRAISDYILHHNYPINCTKGQ